MSGGRLPGVFGRAELGNPKVLPTLGPTAGSGWGKQKRAKERQQAPDS